MAVCPAITARLWGCCVMVGSTGGLSVTVAVADLLGSATLVAVMVTVCTLEIGAGAVYRPVKEIDPIVGLMLHVTEVLLLFVTVAVNCWICESNRLIVFGATLTTIGTSVIAALADLVLSTALVAVMVTVCVAGIRLGAV